MSGISKITVERNQKALLELVVQPYNGELAMVEVRRPVLIIIDTKLDVCADCKVRNPRWASHNLGIFIWYDIDLSSSSATTDINIVV